MHRIEDNELFSIRRVNPVTPEATEPLSEAQIAVAHSKRWRLPVAATPATASYPHAAPEYGFGPPLLKLRENTELGALGLAGLLVVREYFPPTLSMGIADHIVNDVMAKVDLTINGVVPPLRLRGILLNIATDTGDLVFHEQPADYDAGRYRQAGLPPLPSPSGNPSGGFDGPLMPGSV